MAIRQGKTIVFRGKGQGYEQETGGRGGGMARKRAVEDVKALLKADSLVGLVVKASASRAEDPGFESRLWRDFFGVESHQ